MNTTEQFKFRKRMIVHMSRHLIDVLGDRYNKLEHIHTSTELQNTLREIDSYNPLFTSVSYDILELIKLKFPTEEDVIEAVQIMHQGIAGDLKAVLHDVNVEEIYDIDLSKSIDDNRIGVTQLIEDLFDNFMEEYQTIVLDKLAKKEYTLDDLKQLQGAIFDYVVSINHVCIIYKVESLYGSYRAEY